MTQNSVSTTIYLRYFSGLLIICYQLYFIWSIFLLLTEQNHIKFGVSWLWTDLSEKRGRRPSSFIRGVWEWGNGVRKLRNMTVHLMEEETGNSHKTAAYDVHKKKLRSRDHQHKLYFLCERGKSVSSACYTINME